LHPAIGGARGNRYCGPGALAILTGVGTGDAAAAIRQVTGKPAVRGCHHADLVQAGWNLGLRLSRQPSPTATGTLRAWAVRQEPGRYLVNVTGHYVVVRVNLLREVEVADNLTIYPLPLAQFKRAGQRVKRAWRVWN
jgi:hypothetical protein